MTTVLIIIIVFAVIGFIGFIMDEVEIYRHNSIKKTQATSSFSINKQLPESSDLRQMLLLFFNVINDINDNISGDLRTRNRINMYAGGFNNVGLHIRFDKDWEGLKNFAVNQVRYDIPDNNLTGWHSDGRYICYDNDNMQETSEWAKNCMYNAEAIKCDIKNILESFFPNISFSSIDVHLVNDRVSFVVIGEQY